MKPIIAVLLLSLLSLKTTAQKQTHTQLKIEAGVFWDFFDNRIFTSGPFFNIEPQWKASKNSNIGFRVGTAISTQNIISADEFQFYIDNSIGLIGIFSFTPTFDYYFNSRHKNSYVGIGISYYAMNTSKKAFLTRNSFDEKDLSIDNQLGVLVRTGVDWKKLILGLEFNYIPKADAIGPNEQKMGTVQASYLAVSIGRAIAGRTKPK